MRIKKTIWMKKRALVVEYFSSKEDWFLGLESCKPICTPMITGHKLSRKNETSTIEQKKYRSMIGSL